MTEQQEEFENLLSEFHGEAGSAYLYGAAILARRLLDIHRRMNELYRKMYEKELENA